MGQTGTVEAGRMSEKGAFSFVRHEYTAKADITWGQSNQDKEIGQQYLEVRHEDIFDA